MTTTENYLRDVFPLLLERAREAKIQATMNGLESQRNEFLAGRREAYYEVIATLLGQLDAFGIPRDLIGVPEYFDPEKELL